MENSNDTIGNRIRDLPVCSAVPQPTAPPRAARMRNISEKCCGKSTQNLCPERFFFPLNSCRLRDNGEKKYRRTREATDDNMAQVRYMLEN